METKETILALIDQYLAIGTNEKEAVRPLLHFVATEKELFNRKNFTGHITASAFIIDEDACSLLLLKHRSLNRWLQPGGHVDDTDESLVAAALREVIEETGLSATECKLVSNQVFDIDSHGIPENIRKQEPAHVHHDIRFLFQCLNPAKVNFSQVESTGSRWIPFHELAESPDFNWVEKKIRRFTQLANEEQRVNV